jgi:FixJ family two-component response regulator
MRSVPVVYLVDDDRLLCKALGRLFRAAGLRLVAFASGQDFLDYRDFESPSCVVLDVQLPDKSGLELQRELKDCGISVPVIFITGHGDIPMAVEAMRAGAVHFLTKPFNHVDLLRAVRQAHARDSKQLALELESKRVSVLMHSLTPRERSVFQLVAHGLPNKTIAARLGVCLQTVKLHRGNLMQKLHLDSVADLVRLADKAKTIQSRA